MEHLSINKYNTVELKKSFYDLPLHLKYEIILTLPEEVLNDYLTHEKLVLAIIQHSPQERKQELPVQREHKQSKIAKEADLAYQKESKNV